MKYNRHKISFAVLIFIAFVLVLSVWFFYSYAVDSPYCISSEDAKHMIQQGKIDVILDVRTNIERQQLGYYPGSVHIQSADLDKDMPKMYPDKNISILAYCNTGHRARLAVEKLHKLGYSNSVYISSGYKSIMQ